MSFSVLNCNVKTTGAPGAPGLHAVTTVVGLNPGPVTALKVPVKIPSLEDARESHPRQKIVRKPIKVVFNQ